MSEVVALVDAELEQEEDEAGGVPGQPRLVRRQDAPARLHRGWKTSTSHDVGRYILYGDRGNIKIHK